MIVIGQGTMECRREKADQVLIVLTNDPSLCSYSSALVLAIRIYICTGRPAGIDELEGCGAIQSRNEITNQLNQFSDKSLFGKYFSKLQDRKYWFY
jgi:hypothetical protein